MPAISAYAPGKTILLGEHAVVYNRPAIAIPVDKIQARAAIYAEPLRPLGWVWLDAPNINLQTDLSALGKDHPLRMAVDLVLTALEMDHLPACRIQITSTIPVAAGLGSGAAVSVALVRALSAFLGIPLPAEQVCNLAYEVEKRHHGTPSGIDNTVITYDRPIFFIKDQPFELLEVKSPLTLLLADTGIQSPTRTAVEDVRQLWLHDTIRFNDLFDAIGQLVKEARTALQLGDIPRLGLLMQQNQILLQEMTVSSPELDALVNAARNAGAYGAKLSGAGRGGNLIALVESGQSETVSQALLQAGAVSVLTTTLPASS